MYTFVLKVTDSSGQSSTAEVHVFVKPPTNTPPVANAGSDLFISLPQTWVTLNGSSSHDDHRIVAYTWHCVDGPTNSTIVGYNESVANATGLTKGQYVFSLTVLDDNGNSATDNVTVTVTQNKNSPPKANAGGDQILSLPLPVLSLNGSASRDDFRIVSWRWARAASGLAAGTVVLNTDTQPVLMQDEIMKRIERLEKEKKEDKRYINILEDKVESLEQKTRASCLEIRNIPKIKDVNKNETKDDLLGIIKTISTVVNIKLDENEVKDVFRADFRIVSWRWARAASGLAAGTVVLNTDTQPVLMLTNIEPGRYVFELTVTDDQGESDRDTVSVQIKPDPLEMHLLEMTLNVPVSTFTQSQLDSLVQKMALLLKEDVKVNVTEVRGEIDTGNTQLIFFLSEENKAVEGIRALNLVRGAGTDSYGAGVARVRTVRCLSSCSGRGACDQAARACRCDAFWMQSLFTLMQPDAQPDCDWSVVYASLGGIAALCLTCGLCSLCARGARRVAAPRAPRPAPAYRLLPLADHEDKPFTSKDLSESETDSDVLFESKSKTTSFNRLLNGDAQSNWKKNGHHKPSRKVKT
ncbi:unnamed protein product [Plutella xylostella]|uniref:(diamondback moth) hypothetical protein n=1 Tax=Plutella xylostella TaxID=51655 RepID=A0A8S4E9G1_PLUXY|nr:unnamed protein product [Plutella xylostella]